MLVGVKRIIRGMGTADPEAIAVIEVAIRRDGLMFERDGWEVYGAGDAKGTAKSAQHQRKKEHNIKTAGIGIGMDG
jgi:hypothetical protein